MASIHKPARPGSSTGTKGACLAATLEMCNDWSLVSGSNLQVMELQSSATSILLPNRLGSRDLERMATLRVSIACVRSVQIRTDINNRAPLEM